MVLKFVFFSFYFLYNFDFFMFKCNLCLRDCQWEKRNPRKDIWADPDLELIAQDPLKLRQLLKIGAIKISKSGRIKRTWLLQPTCRYGRGT